MTGRASSPNESVVALQDAYLSRCAPGFRIRRVRWSGGNTAVIEGGRGSTMLLVHGGGGAAFQWGPILPLLAMRYRVLAVDRPGHGLADPFEYHDVDLFEHANLVLGSRWGQVHVPTTFVIGEHDQAASVDEVSAVVAGNPRFSFVRLPGVGHVPWVDDAEKVAGALGALQLEGQVTTA